MGIRYKEGRGVAQNYKEAVKWFQKAAEQGNVDAQVSLGARHAFGEGTPKDFIRAHMWFVIAASQGRPRSRDKFKKYLSPAQLETAQRLAREWMERRQK